MGQARGELVPAAVEPLGVHRGEGEVNLTKEYVLTEQTGVEQAHTYYSPLETPFALDLHRHTSHDIKG